SSSRSKAGRVPLVDVNRSRASRTRCAAARRFETGAAAGGSAGSWTTSGFSAGLLITQHKSCSQKRASFRTIYLWREILKRWLRKLKNYLNQGLRAAFEEASPVS